MSVVTITALTLAQASAPAAQGPGDTPWMIYAIIAFGAAIMLLVVEAFVPSGGVLGALGAILAVAGIVMFFMFDTTWGMVSMAVTLAASPFAVAAMLWLLPNTPIGRAMIHRNEEPGEATAAPRPTDEKAITVGLEGEALTELRPVGACRLNGKRHDCIAQHGLISAGTRVRVVEVSGVGVKVKAI